MSYDFAVKKSSHQFFNQLTHALKEGDWMEVLCQRVVRAVRFGYRTDYCFPPQ